MTETCRVLLLADALHCIPMIANWYKCEWSAWFRDTPADEIEADFRTVANRDCLPIVLVAVDGATNPLGACSVRADQFEPYSHAGPWLRGMYVHTPFRGQGVAQQMICAAPYSKKVELRVKSVAQFIARRHLAGLTER